VRGLSAFAAGLCLVPVGLPVVMLSPRTGRLVGARGPRPPLVVAGAALALGGGASLGLGIGVLVLGLLSTGCRALATAGRAAALFDEVDRGTDLRTVSLRR
jgi:hypothetical protein